MRVLAVGATGTVTGLVTSALSERGVTVRALVRTAERAAQARARGVTEVAIADLDDPTSLRAAATGVDGVFHVNPAFAPTQAQMGVAMVRAAEAAGVTKFVFSGVYHPSISAMVNHAAKRPVEEALYESSLDFAILQPAMFMQNLDRVWSVVRETGRLVLPYSARAKVSFVDYRDVAEAAALAMTTNRLSYGTFELAASGMVDRYELADMMSAASGLRIGAGEVAVEDWIAGAPMPPGPILDGLAVMNAHYDRYGFPGGNALVLRAVLGREPRTLAAYVTELAARPLPQ